MELQEAIRTRRSIRSFLPKTVPEKTILDLISEALWAPSWANTQPWEIIVVTGEPLAEVQARKQGGASFRSNLYPRHPHAKEVA